MRFDRLLLRHHLDAVSRLSLAARASYFSLQGPKEKEPKERALSPRKQQPATLPFKRILRLGILPRRKTAHIHVRRPTGLMDRSGCKLMKSKPTRRGWTLRSAFAYETFSWLSLLLVTMPDQQ
jgi:hypothetical protein